MKTEQEKESMDMWSHAPLNYCARMWVTGETCGVTNPCYYCRRKAAAPFKCDIVGRAGSSIDSSEPEPCHCLFCLGQWQYADIEK